MTAEKAVEIAQTCGAFQPGFFGEVTIRIASGGVTAVDVKQTFIERKSAD